MLMEFVGCGSWLHGEPKCVHELFSIFQVCPSRKLVSWEAIRFNEKLRKENMLRISWEVTPKRGFLRLGWLVHILLNLTNREA